MSCFSRHRIALPCLVLASLYFAGQAAVAQTVWSGLTKTVFKPSFADHTLPENQDVLTANVIFTRHQFGGGLINIAAEDLYTSFVSPLDTEWATDFTTDETIAATNWQALESAEAFTSWIEAFGGTGTQGTLIAGRAAVVHLITDDIYLDLQFESFLPGQGNSYTYVRAEPLEPPANGDFNDDGVVDAADYVMWRKDESIGSYDDWVKTFGNNLGAGGGSAVPEPSAGSLLALSALMFVAGKRWPSKATNSPRLRRRSLWVVRSVAAR
jgi:hypothetical protein